jgi:hypothetical protein
LITSPVAGLIVAIGINGSSSSQVRIFVRQRAGAERCLKGSILD